MSPPDTARQHRLTPGEQERIFRGQGGGVRGGDGTRLFEPATTTPAQAATSVGVPLEALRLANRDVPGWLSREAERAIVEATDAIRGALSGSGGQ